MPERIAASLLAVVIALQPGCAAPDLHHASVPKTKDQTDLGRVAVVASAQEAEVELQEHAPSKGKGAARGALAGMRCMEFGILALIVCPISIPVGAVVGSATTADTDQSRTRPKTLEGELVESQIEQSPKLAQESNRETVEHIQKNIQESLRYQVFSVALAMGEDLVAVSGESARLASHQRDYRPLVAAGVDSIVEVGLSRIDNGDTSLHVDKPFPLYMQAHVRLIRTKDNAEFFSDDYAYLGERLNLSEWAANKGERLRHALQAGYEAMAADIYKDIFLLHPFPDRDAHPLNQSLPTYGLAPIYPPAPSKLDVGSVKELKRTGFKWWATVNSLRPSLRWQGFPRTSDFIVAPEVMQRVKNVRYDLAISRYAGLGLPEVVYQREGLTDTTHTVETDLKARSRYYWAIRARFEIDGHERVSEWSSIDPLERRAWKVFHANALRLGWSVPSWQWAYRFNTP
jgi:hypothetical protein